MSVRWDPLLTAAVARELEEKLAGGRVLAIGLDGESRRFILYLKEATLVFELHPRSGWVSLLPPVPAPTEAHRLPARIRSVRPLPDESALSIRLAGKEGGIEIVVEWVGTRWNAIVVDEESRTIRHILLTREEASRTLRVGARYEAPVSTGTKGWTRWGTMTDPSHWGGWILVTERGLQPYPVAAEGVVAEPAADLIEAFRVAREREEGGAGSARGLLVPAALLERGEARLSRLRGRAHRLRKELEAAPDPAPLRLRGDLILARWGEIPSGVDHVLLTDFDGVPIEIPLDPALRPDENAARSYDEAGRAERALATLPERIRKAETEVERWKELVEGVREGRLPADRLEKALGREGSAEASGRRKTGAKKVAKPEPLPYRRFRSSGGLEIRVGKGARQNDDLTFHHSAPNDVWLHAGQVSGAHVILRWDREGNPPKRDLEEAAILAALNSGARHSGMVSITWTRRKYVRKPRKAPPGTVIAERVQTLFVEPDPGLSDRLSPKEEEEE